MKERLIQLSETVENKFRELDQNMKAFALKTGIRCREACGECCKNPNVEASLVEMLPLARKLISESKNESVYERLLQVKKSGPCILYEEHSASEGLGRCTQYEFRPALCRSFGFSGRREKDSSLKYMACHWHKKLHPEKVEEAQKRDDIPLISDAIAARWCLDASLKDLEARPINEALASAIEKWKLSDLEPDEPPLEPDLAQGLA